MTLTFSVDNYFPKAVTLALVSLINAVPGSPCNSSYSLFSSELRSTIIFDGFFRPFLGDALMKQLLA